VDSLEESDFVIGRVWCGEWSGGPCGFGRWGILRRVGGVEGLEVRFTGGAAGDDFDALLGVGEFFLAGFEEESSAFVAFDEFVEGELTVFEDVDDSVQLLHGIFEGEGV
jgi:hypothetical protein